MGLVSETTIVRFFDFADEFTIPSSVKQTIDTFPCLLDTRYVSLKVLVKVHFFCLDELMLG